MGFFFISIICKPLRRVSVGLERVSSHAAAHCSSKINVRQLKCHPEGNVPGHSGLSFHCLPAL